MSINEKETRYKDKIPLKIVKLPAESLSTNPMEPMNYSLSGWVCPDTAKIAMVLIPKIQFLNTSNTSEFVIRNQFASIQFLSRQ